jgi:hypothetical protein
MAYDHSGLNAAELAMQEAEARRRGVSVTALRMQQVMQGPNGQDVMRAIVEDNRRRPVGPTLMAPDGPRRHTEVVRGNGWQTPVPLASPPGQEIIRQMCEADADRQLMATPEGRLAKVKALMKQAQRLIDEGVGDRAKLEEVIAQGQALLGV